MNTWIALHTHTHTHTHTQSVSKLQRRKHYFGSLVVVVVIVIVDQSFLTVCDPTDCSPPGSSAYGVSQAKNLEWVTIPFYRGSS